MFALAKAAACSVVEADALRLYGNSDLVLATGYTANETCFRVVIIKQSENLCRRRAGASSTLAASRLKFRTVTATALSYRGATRPERIKDPSTEKKNPRSTRR